MKFKLQIIVALIIRVVWELLQYVGYILIAPWMVFLKELWEAITAFPFRAIRFAWMKYKEFYTRGSMDA